MCFIHCRSSFSGLLSSFVSAKAQRMVINSIAKPFLRVRRGKNMQFCWIIDHWCIGWLTVSQSLDSPCAKGSLRNTDETLTLIIESFMSLANCQVYRIVFFFSIFFFKSGITEWKLLEQSRTVPKTLNFLFVYTVRHIFISSLEFGSVVDRLTESSCTK